MPLTTRSHLFALAACLSTLAAAAGAAVLHAGDGEARSTLTLRLHTEGEADAVEIDDLDELAVGDRRDYTTDGGRPLVVTRDARGYAVEIDGRTIRVDDGDLPHAVGHPPLAMHRIEIDGDGDAKRFVVSTGGDAERVVVRRGPAGADAFAFRSDGGDPGLLLLRHHGLLERIERSEKFQALDDATQELVRELVREAERPLAWVDAEGDERDRLEIRLERRAPGDEAP